MLLAGLKAFLLFSLLLTLSLKSHFSLVHFLFCIAEIVVLEDFGEVVSSSLHEHF